MCFPPSYRIFQAVVSEYHAQLGYMIDFAGLCAENLSNSDILRIIRWITDYQESAGELGMEDEDVQFPGGCGDGGGGGACESAGERDVPRVPHIC